MNVDSLGIQASHRPRFGKPAEPPALAPAAPSARGARGAGPIDTVSLSAPAFARLNDPSAASPSSSKPEVKEADRPSEDLNAIFDRLLKPLEGTLVSLKGEPDGGKSLLAALKGTEIGDQLDAHGGWDPTREDAYALVGEDGSVLGLLLTGQGNALVREGRAELAIRQNRS